MPSSIINSDDGVISGTSGLKSTGGDDGVLKIQNNGTDAITVTPAGLFQFNSGYGSVATAYGCRAWVNFNGTGTPAIRASGNVTSITDNNTGDYTVNFTTAMPDANYCVVTQGTSSGKGYIVNAPKNAVSGNITTTAVTMINADFNGNTNDFEYMFVAIFR